MAANLITPADRSDSSPAFLELAPPHLAARSLAYLIILVCVIGGIAAVVIQMPETVSAQFVLVPVRGADPIKAARQGVITQIFVNEGQTVKHGETIAVLKSEAVGDRTADLQTIQTQLAGAGETLLNAKLKFETQRLSDEQEARKLEGRAAHFARLIGHKQNQLALTRQMAESYEKLYREGIASRAQYTARQLEVSALTGELEQLEAERRETLAAIEKLGIEANARQAEQREFERKLRETTATGEIRAAALKTSLAGSAGSDVVLIAPCSGSILRLRIKDRGAVVGEGETIAEMACDGSPLHAELTVPEAGVGKLKIDQGVKLKYDAFPYQRFGVKGGKLAWVSPSSIEGPSGANFKARVEIADKEVIVKGQPQRLAPGMSGQAEIVVGKRSLISYAFEPIRQLKENFADAPEIAISRQR
jgi:multidrug efflux pump subunit AcrA (membrane-fusion protein)